MLFVAHDRQLFNLKNAATDSVKTGKGLILAFDGDASAPAKLLGGLGAVGALCFGVQGVRALVIAMIEAKREGEAKKKASLEARRAARKAGQKVPPRAPRKPRS